MLVSPDVRKLVEQDQELLIVRLEATPSEMRQLDLGANGLSDKWAVEFARRALPNMPRLEALGCERARFAGCAASSDCLGRAACTATTSATPERWRSRRSWRRGAAPSSWRCSKRRLPAPSPVVSLSLRCVGAALAETEGSATTTERRSTPLARPAAGLGPARRRAARRRRCRPVLPERDVAGHIGCSGLALQTPFLRRASALCQCRRSATL